MPCGEFGANFIADFTPRAQHVLCHPFVSRTPHALELFFAVGRAVL